MDHQQCCQTTAQCTPVAKITPPHNDQQPRPLVAAGTAPPDEDQQSTVAAATGETFQDEQLTLLGEIVTMIYQTTTQDAHRNYMVQRNLAQAMNE